MFYKWETTRPFLHELNFELRIVIIYNGPNEEQGDQNS
jgi:hypothetical protein